TAICILIMNLLYERESAFARGKILTSNYLERLRDWRDWKEIRELLEEAHHHFGLGLEADGEEFLFTVDGQRRKLARKDFKIIRPMTAKEKERDEHERKEAQRELEKKLKENYVASSQPVHHMKTLRQVFAPITFA
ncbi:MAG: hypothetical protein ONA90_09980, partial [candidate division KSB1 bacterium]|nr:hypothetical protein [candidate division KSB1 bacterium]